MSEVEKSNIDKQVDAYDFVVDAASRLENLPANMSRRERDIRLRQNYPGKHPKEASDAAPILAKETDPTRFIAIVTETLRKIFQGNLHRLF